MTDFQKIAHYKQLAISAEDNGDIALALKYLQMASLYELAEKAHVAEMGPRLLLE